ncbi:hypothetical protein K438DRAFT_2060424 [Mycena galopus ATCC 62051]|nr:hypothetical protein K438DRAFT_2060424 [Mycena galopus ATCC 62051]
MSDMPGGRPYDSNLYQAYPSMGSNMPGGSMLFNTDSDMASANLHYFDPSDPRNQNPWAQPNGGPSLDPSLGHLNGGQDIEMNDEDTQSPPGTIVFHRAAQDTLPTEHHNPAKRFAVSNPDREDLRIERELTDHAQNKAKVALQGKREVEAQLREAQEEINSLRSKVENWERERQQWDEGWAQVQKDLHANFNARLETQQRRHQEVMKTAMVGEGAVVTGGGLIFFQAARTEQFKQQLAAHSEAGLEERLQRERAKWHEQVQTQLDAQKSATMAEIEKEALEMKQQQEKERADMKLEAEKRRVEYETKMAAFHSRTIGRRQNNNTEDGTPSAFPNSVEVIIRGGGRFQAVSMTNPTPSSSGAPQSEDEPPSSAPSSAPSSSSSPSPSPDLLAALENPLIQQRIKEMVGEKLKAKAKGSKRKAKLGSAAALTRARQAQQETITYEEDLSWKTLVREKYRFMTGITRSKDFFDYEGVAGATVKRCEAGDPSAHPQGTNDKLFFGEGWATSLWNRMIFDKAIEELLAQRAKDPGQYDVPDVSKDYLVALFINCLRLGRAEWSRNQPADGEMFVQAREGAQEYGEERADRSMGTSRKKHKFEGRVRTSERMMAVSLAKQDRTSADTWKWFKDDLLPELDKGEMSSEEDESAEVIVGNIRKVQTVHGIKICAWRAPKITDYLKMIDEAGEGVLVKCTNKRMRIRGTKELTSEPPHGLPRALYNEAWLTQRKPYVPDIETQLDIAEKEFTLMDITAGAN